jgi:hypothetical protein
MKAVYSGNEDWLSRQRWIPIVLVAVAVIGGWAVGSRRKQGVADKDSKTQMVQPMAEKTQMPKQAVPEPGAAEIPAPAPARGAKIETISAVQSGPTAAAAASIASGTDKGDQNLRDAAKRAKQRQACLELAKDNPSILCK